MAKKRIVNGIVVALIVGIAAAFYMAGGSKGVMNDVDVQNLIEQERDLNDKCRGGPGDDPRSMEFCEKRDVLIAELGKRGWCYGTPEQAGYQRKWQICDADEEGTKVEPSQSEIVSPQVLRPQLSHALDQIEAATHDPQKVRIMECMGIDVYDDPRPAGHPPTKTECDFIESKIRLGDAAEWAPEPYGTVRSAYLVQVRQLYFAVGCKVFASEAGVLPLISLLGDEVRAAAPTYIDRDAQGLLHEAAREGMEMATKVGECQFWSDRPEIKEAVINAAVQAAAFR